MLYIIALIVISLGCTNCFVFFKHCDVPGLENDVSEINYNAQVWAEWIDQPLDHFNANNKTWKMRYYKRLDFWKPNGPIYLFIEGQKHGIPTWIQKDSNLVCQLAAETSGALFLSEHRYYGLSIPVDVTDASSLKYLNSKQALADLAELIKSIKSEPEFKSSKVVVIGGSYAGNLAAWMRVVYPDLVDAAVSSSAPVLAKKDVYEYYETVGDVYEKYGSTDCLNKIKIMFNLYDELLKTSNGILTLKKEFDICNDCDMSVKENQEYFFRYLMDYFAGHAYKSPDKIKLVCDIFQTSNWAQVMQKDMKAAMKRLTGLTPKLNGSTICSNFDFAAYMWYYYRHTDYFKSFYQSCTEFGYCPDSTSNKQPFTNNLPIAFFIKICQSLFGEDFNEKRMDDGIAQTNAMYGGIKPNVTNVVFTHGDMDPWHRLGVLEDLSDTAVVRITNGTSQCAVLGSPQKSDPKALVEDREYVKSMIKKWIRRV